MFRIAKILFLFLYISIFAQERETNYNLFYPRFIPKNTSFEISLTVTNSYPNADEFELLIISEERLTLNKAEFKSVYESVNLDPSTIISDDFFNEIYSLKINLKDSLKEEGIVFQILLNMKIEQSNSSQIKFKGMFKENNNVVAYLTPQSDYDISGENYFSASLDFYKPHKLAEKALTFDENALFQIDMEKSFDNNFLLDFWVKFNEPSLQFLKIFRKDYTEPDYEISINKFQMLSVSSEEFNQLHLKPYFIGKKSWYHFSIVTSKERGIISFYCNGFLIAKHQLPPLLDESNMRFIFDNPEKDKAYIIDLLKIIDLNSSINFSFNNRHSTHFSSDSSSLIALYKFDSSNEFLTQNKNIKLEFSNVKFVRSDAPLFARSPELNIKLLGNIYELEWKGGDYKQAQYYILEKSSGTKSYNQIHIVQADNSQEKIYTFIDAVDHSAEVIFYRVIQQNYDGSVVYSSQVKVGQGITEPFSMGQNYPNPFNPKTSIEIEILEDSDIEITIYSLDGREIAKLHKGFLSKGLHKFSFDGAELPSGIYLYKVASPNFNQTKKMILTK